MSPDASSFTPQSLPTAVRHLFELNQFDVTGPVTIHGAEVDLVARPRTDPFATPIYIEVTVEYVDNEKYGKDVGKLAMIAHIEQSARKMIVSSVGFTAPVKERALKTGIDTYTYHELFARFERFEPYITLLTKGAPPGARAAAELRRLVDVYEEPVFQDNLGTEPATAYLEKWRSGAIPASRWLVIVGEYGTGKTALTRVQQYRWLVDYHKDPQSPLPFRIELRDFTKQFDSRGLLHHFLDSNGLQHVPIDFVLSLIRSGRLILLLDGYDEMAQYMHARERRTCLEALASLSAEGARGILTSRPNYFSEAEELQLFEVLYRRLERTEVALTLPTQQYLAGEKQVDELLQSHFLERHERTLRDLSPEQTEALVGRILRDDPVGRSTVLALLRRAFSSREEGSHLSLSGKPVIISYLLEVVEGLKAADADSLPLSEWQIYRLIVDQLMNRDFLRSANILPERRRNFLTRLSVWLSKRENPFIAEGDFRNLIRQEFDVELRRVPADSREDELERYFADLRSSATLTRVTQASRDGWKFSHNSLREYFLASHLLDGLAAQTPISDDVPITDPMRAFVAGLDDTVLHGHLSALASLWLRPDLRVNLGRYLMLFWRAALRLSNQGSDRAREALQRVSGSGLVLTGTTINRLAFSADGEGAQLDGLRADAAIFSHIDFSGCSLVGATFAGALLESVNWRDAVLTNAVFTRAFVSDCDFSDCDLRGTDFSGVSLENLSILLDAPATPRRLTGREALGYLRFVGAKTDVLPYYYSLLHHSDYEWIDKIMRRLREQAKRQRRGLVQRGPARDRTELAESLVALFESNQWLRAIGRKRSQVELTEQGRHVVGKFLDVHEIEPTLETWLRRNVWAG